MPVPCVRTDLFPRETLTSFFPKKEPSTQIFCFTEDNGTLDSTPTPRVSGGRRRTEETGEVSRGDPSPRVP